MADDRTESDKEVAPFRWSEAAEVAAYQVALDDLTDGAIAELADIARSTLSLWKRHPEFAARVDANRAEIGAAVRRRGIAVLENRVRALNDRWHRLRRVLDARAADPDLAGVPGGDTGLLVRTTKGIGAGENFQVVEEFAVDTGLLAELRAVERQAAQELGQWAEKVDHSGGLKVVVEYADRPIDPTPPAPGPG